MSKLDYQYEQVVDYLHTPSVHYIHTNTNSVIDEEEQEKKSQLIQQATNRLRQKLLETKYETLLSQIVEIQSKLDIIKLEATISLQSIDANHLNHFEKRLENHKFDLENIQGTTKPNTPSLSLSSILSLNEEDYFVSIGQKKKRRRSTRIIKQDEQSSSSSTSSDIGRNELIVLHSIQDSNNNGPINSSCSLLDKRNALDDTLSFLNDLGSDDGGFRQDIINLLDHPTLY
ncbi:hypothetical protein INT48_003962 [Thamnidium elegans]|uniref:Uncharacterized protein n=1 Tax=Thamnidium elegans TaxID=101142 RepID=A0A8H7VWJ1_9FUNG|nr:hypothetical protein INT48_003962 [Thamnidium elegans]